MEDFNHKLAKNVEASKQEFSDQVALKFAQEEHKLHGVVSEAKTEFDTQRQEINSHRSAIRDRRTIAP